MKLLQANAGLVAVLTPLFFIFLPKLRLAPTNATCSPGPGSIIVDPPPVSVPTPPAVNVVVKEAANSSNRETKSDEEEASSSSSNVEAGLNVPLSDAEKLLMLNASVVENEKNLIEKRGEVMKLQSEVLLTTAIENAQDQADYLGRALAKKGREPVPGPAVTMTPVLPMQP